MKSTIPQPKPDPDLLEAIYLPSALPEYAGNPLVEALPPFRTPEEIMLKFGRFPNFHPSDRELSVAHRMLCVSRLGNYFEPLTPHFDVIIQLGLLIHGGYRHRNPINPAYKKALVNFYRRSMNGEICPIETSGPSTAPSFSLFGVSGVGKSTVVERALSFYPQALAHPSHGFWQLVWLKVDCPMDGSLKQLLRSIVSKMDAILGTNYAQMIGSRAGVDELILFVGKIAAQHHLGVLIVDEIQNLLDASGVGPAKMLNFFVTLANDVKVPFVVLGTPKAQLLLENAFRESRRLTDHGSLTWDRMEPGDEWKFFLEELWKFQWTKHPVEVTSALSEAVYFHTQGIRALVVRLFQFGQLQAMRDKSERLTDKLLKKVAKERFKLVEPALNALRSGKKDLIRHYEDLFLDGLATLNTQVEQNARMEALKASKLEEKRTNDGRARLISTLVHLGSSQRDASALAELLFANQGLSDIDQATLVPRSGQALSGRGDLTKLLEEANLKGKSAAEVLSSIVGAGNDASE
jgi:hypothetical protein